MDKFFVNVYATDGPDTSCECFTCDASCICEVCDGDSECNWG